jgi:type IV fimbrial biogenesis protein FimT
MRLKKYLCNRQGFTLVELIVATAIMGLLAELMAMGLADQLPKRRLNGAARNLMLDVMEARLQAIHQNRYE